MKKFGEFLSEAATEGAVLETVIVAAWNGETPPKTKSIAPDAGEKIVAYLKKQGISGTKAIKLETAGVDVTKEWSQFWEPESVPGSTKTPKTDIMIGKNRISLKMGAAQLMSGGQNESKATFYAATKSIGGMTAELEKIWKKMDELAKSSVASSEVATELKKGKDKVLMKANEVNNEVKEALRVAFNKNEEFKRAFVREAMTGEVKFSRKADAYAEYVLSTTPDGSKVNLHKATNKAFLDKVADKTNVTVRFKTTSVKTKGEKTGKYRYWTVVSLGLAKLEEEINAAGNLLTEGIISSIFQRVRNYMTSLFTSIWNSIRNSVKKVLEFFGFEPEVLFNNNINFNDI
jgi:hypothetical protein